MKKVWSLILVTFSLLIAGCSDDDKMPADADDNFITALTLTKEGKSYDAVIEGNDIVMTVPYTVDLNGATASMVYTPSAKILPNPQTVTDWENEMIFRVTSFNGKENEYTYKVIKSEIESDGDVVLKSQADVDAFAETKVSVIKGNLIIGDNAENTASINNLEALSGIKEITGSLQILNNYKGEALDGLNITKVGGIQLGTKEAPSPCADTYRFRLEQLQEITGNLELNNNAVQFIEFDNLTKVEGDIYIKDDALITLYFPKLADVGGDLDLSDNSVVRHENGTSDIKDTPIAQLEFPALENVSGKFSINMPSDNFQSLRLPKLQTAGEIDFLVGWQFKTLEIPEISEVNGNLLLSGRYESTAYAKYLNQTLERIVGLNSLKQVKGTLNSSNFGAMSELPNLSSLSLVGGVFIENLWGLQGKGVVCDLSNASFQSFNDVTPFIHTGGTAFDKLKTIDDLSNVNIEMAIICYADRCIPEINLKKASDFTCKFDFSNLAANGKNLPITLEEILGDVDIMVQSSPNKSIDLSNIRSVEGNFFFNSTLAKSVDFSSLEKVGGYFCLQSLNGKGLKLDKLQSVNMSGINKSRAGFGAEERRKGLFIQSLSEISLPDLESVGGLCGFLNYTGLSCPKLKSVSEKLFISTAPNCSQVSFPALNSVPNIKIENNGKLSDFSTFATVIENGSVTDGNWEVTGCKYNPTWQDMKEGRCKPAE